MGCVYVRKCHLNNCPVGVATTDPKWRAKFKGTPDHVVNFMMGVASEAREIIASLGARSLDELIGRPSEFLEQKEIKDHPKANLVDLSAVLADKAEKDAVRVCTDARNDGIHKPALDLQILKDIASHTGIESGNPAENLMDRGPFEATYDVVNTDRNIGTRTAGRVAEAFGNYDLAAGSINLTFNGTAGQSFGTFLTNGLKLTLIGEGNDYVGKGMAGGEIIVHPPQGISSDFEAAKNSIAGNTCLYGATAVCEGTGDHGCEYMTNGLAVILGLTGKNFGAGMSGGTAYIYDIDGKFQSRLNDEMVVALPISRQEDIDILKPLIEAHAEKTGSPRAKEILENWETTLPKIVRVIPKEKHALELAEHQHEDADGVMAN